MIDNTVDREYRDELPSSSKWVKENFVLGDILGSGTFGKVYTVECRKKPDTLYAMKEVTRGSQPRYIATELRIMRQLGGTCNVMNIHAAFRERDRVFIVMDYFPHDPIKEWLANISNREVIDYMKNLFIALDYLHRNNVIHRDVKPANFLYNRELKRYSLIDFGLSQIYTPKSLSPGSKENTATLLSPKKRGVKRLSISGNTQDNSDIVEKKRKLSCDCFHLPKLCGICRTKPVKNVNKAGTPGFRAPEILLRFNEQTPALDIWSAGVTLLSLLFRRHPIFRPADDFEGLAQIAQLIGMEAVVEVAAKEGITLLCEPPFPGVDIIKLMRCLRDGLDVLINTPDRCGPCGNLFYNNVRGKCLCKSSEVSSMDALPPEERVSIEILRRCLEPDPTVRYTARMLLDLIKL